MTCTLCDGIAPPANVVERGQLGSKKYFSLETLQAFYAANDSCVDIGGTLAMPKTEEEWVYVENVMTCKAKPLK